MCSVPFIPELIGVQKRLPGERETMFSKWLLFYVLSVHVLLSDCNVLPNKTKPCSTVRLVRGRVKYLQKGKLARFQCNSGYILAGERYSSCIKGAWDAKTPVCVKPSCATVKAPLNGLIYPQYQGAVLNFLCKPGYSLRGSQSSYCDGFAWSNNLPTCAATGSEPPMSCDFESVDLCGWQHDLNHNFDWRRYNFQTPSGHIGTGPRSDHTKGEGKDGFYMYIESSSRIENDTARLLSPVYNKMEQGLCFTFYYHMFGAGIGSLRVYVKQQSQGYDTKHLTAEFVESGNQGDVWKRGVVSVTSVDEPFQIIVEGIRGKSYVSDIAIDDVNLVQYECEDYEFSTVSTTEESTEVVPIVESCLNRCDNSSDTIYTDSFVLACDCVDTCIENNSCCPDYVAVCLLGSVTEFTESYGTSSNYDGTEEPTVIDTTTRKLTTTPAPGSRATPPTSPVTRPAVTAVAPVTIDKVQARTRYNGPYTGVWWMDTTTSSSAVTAVIARPPRNTTVRPVITNRNSSAGPVQPANVTVQPTTTTARPATRRWYNATTIPKRSATTVRPRYPYRPARIGGTNTTVTNNTNTTASATNVRPYFPVKTSTSTVKPGIGNTTRSNGTNIRPYFPTKTTTSVIKPRIENPTRTNGTNIRPYFPTKTTTSHLKPGIENTTRTNGTNIRPYFPTKTTTSNLKPAIENTTRTNGTNILPYVPIKVTLAPVKPKSLPKARENEVIKPVVPTRSKKPLPPAPAATAAPAVSVPVVPIVQDDVNSATLEMETDYVDTNSQQPVLYAKNEPIVEAKTTTDTHIIMGVLCGVVLVMMVALGAVLVGRRRNWKLCRRFHGVRRSDSMSDVRFLASDEVLDFTWRSAHN